MAKQKIKKENKDVEKAVCVGMSSFDLGKRIIALEQRIDRIVIAIDKSKKVRGL